MIGIGDGLTLFNSEATFNLLFIPIINIHELPQLRMMQ